MLDRVVIINDFSVARGGATGLAILSARLLRERGIPVTFITGDDGSDSELEELGVDVQSIGGRRILHENPVKSAVKGIYNPAAVRVVGDWIAKNDTPNTAYHLHGWAQILSPSVFLPLKRVSGRCYIHAHDFFLACPNGSFTDFRRREPCERTPLSADCLLTHCDKRSYPQKLWRMARHTALSADLDKKGSWAGILVIHERMGAYMEKAGYSRNLIKPLRNPATPFSRERIRAEDNDVFYFVGRMVPEKGIEELIEAAAQAGVSLAVIGDGPLREELSRRYPGVRFLGWKSHADISRCLSEARAVVMPSLLQEPFGLVAAEASSSGLPIIVSETAFLCQEIKNSGTGFCCAPRDKSEFAALLSKIRDMPRSQIRDMSERAFRGEVPLSSTPDSWIESLLALYESAVMPVRV